MVRIEELRVGNYVYGASDRIEKVCAINSKHKECEVDTENIGILFHNNFNDIFPIPLTEEILLKCGFVNYGFNLMRLDFKHLIFTINMQGSFYIGAHRVLYQVDYLHQLQNLYFALTGKELEIEL